MGKVPTRGKGSRTGAGRRRPHRGCRPATAQRHLGRVVKAVDSKSTGLRPRRFESGRCRKIFVILFCGSFPKNDTTVADVHQQACIPGV